MRSPPLRQSQPSGPDVLPPRRRLRRLRGRRPPRPGDLPPPSPSRSRRRTSGSRATPGRRRALRHCSPPGRTGRRGGRGRAGRRRPSASSGTVRPTASASSERAHELCGRFDRLGLKALDLGRERARRGPDQARDEAAVPLGEPDDCDLRAGAVNRGFGELRQDRLECRALGESTAGPRERGERLGDVDATVDHRWMVAAMRSPVSWRALAALGCGGRSPSMLVASVATWRREADGPAGRPRSGLEAGPGAAQTRQSAPRAREIVAATILKGRRGARPRARS